MQIKNLFADKDAVSPVIGVILMVAITVILAAVIGAFVLGIGGSQEKAPQASFEIGMSSGTATITHQGGDAIDIDQISISGDVNVGQGSVGIAGGGDGGPEWEAGEYVTPGGSSGDSVSIVWHSPSSDSTNIIGQGEF